MQSLIINGGRRLAGTLSVHGAKNSVLPLISATILLNGKSVLHNCPDLSDVSAALDIIKSLGLSSSQEGSDIEIISYDTDAFRIPDDLMRSMRSSVMFLGSILARHNRAVISTPGGCMLGPRPIDIHIKSLSKLGVSVTEKNGRLEFLAENGLIGADITLDFPSVGATENLILASVLAKGTTTIYNAAREPEIKDLSDFLNKAGANISGSGTDTIKITGVKELSGVEYTVIPDRIEAATYMAAVAVTGGELELNNVVPNHLLAVNSVLREAGCEINCDDNSLSLFAPLRLKSVKTVRTQPFPGFPTDAGPLLISALSSAEGVTVFYENIFENRYSFVDELKRFGANVETHGPVAVVNGVNVFSPASCDCTDLRGGAALIIAALKANGKSRINKLCHINRGYQDIAENLRSLGADVYYM